MLPSVPKQPLIRGVFAVFLLLSAVVGQPHPGRAGEPQPVTVFAASSLTDVLQDLARRYRERHDVVIRFSFASPSTLARQIEAGAAADIFVSANEEWADYLAERGLLAPGTRVSPVGNALVMIAPLDSPLRTVSIDGGLDLAELVGSGGRIVTGDPAHVPVGRYARTAFEHLGLWPAAEPLLARADSVRAALALVERGEAPLGIVYATDARASREVKVVGSFPADSHPPIRYPFAIVAGRDTPTVRQFFAFVTTGPAAGVYEAYGFLWRGPTG